MRGATKILLLMVSMVSSLESACRGQEPLGRLVAAPTDPRLKGAEYAQSAPAMFSWTLFVYLIQPAQEGGRDLLPLVEEQRRIGSSAGTLWESWKDTTEVFLPDGSEPSPWENTIHPMLPTNAVAMRTRLPGADSTRLHYLPAERLIDSRMIDGQQIVSVSGGKPELIRYNVRVNKAYFDYVVENQLYNLEGQEAARLDSSFVFDFPTDTLEVKAAWRILEETDDPSRYWTAHAVFHDQGQMRYARVGLTALHIISKVLPNWFWVTFEQVDNSTETYEYFLQEKGPPVGPNVTRNPLAEEGNRVFQRLLAATKWKHYELIGWQFESVDEHDKPTLLANTQIETYFQRHSSCITCHDMANIGPDHYRRLSMWQRGRDGIRGYIGEVDFDRLVQQEQPGEIFKQMDYVWSLRQAKKRSPRR